MTHFRPDEIDITAQDAVRLGYTTDVGDPVTRDDQVIEIYPQDIVVPWSCVDGLLNVCRFVDDELEHIYGMDRIYECQKPNDLIGQLAMGLAPHIGSGAVQDHRVRPSKDTTDTHASMPPSDLAATATSTAS